MMILNRQRRVAVSIPSLSEFLSEVGGVFGLADEALSVRLVSDRAMARLNQTYRGRRGPTDVLAFPANAGGRANRGGKGSYGSRGGKGGRGERGRDESSGGLTLLTSSSYVGDIAISVETARRNARRLRQTLRDELRMLILHGVLHLLGYDHETDQGEMIRLEGRLRRRLRLV